MINSTPHRLPDRTDPVPELKTPQPPKKFNALYIIHKEIAVAALANIKPLLESHTVHSMPMVPPGTDDDLLDESVFIFPGANLMAHSISELPEVTMLVKDIVRLQIHGAHVDLVCVNERQEELDWEVPFLQHHRDNSGHITPHNLHEAGELFKEVLKTFPAALLAVKRFMWEEDGAGKLKRTKVYGSNETTTLITSRDNS